MTDEEIKQKAEYFATHLNGEKTPFSSREYEAYIAGAHSRDEEIKRLEKALSSAQKGMAELAELYNKKGEIRLWK